MIKIHSGTLGMKAKFMCILGMAGRKRPLLVPIPCGSCTWSISENSWVEQSAHHHHEVLNRAIAQHLMQDDLQENLDRL